MTSVRLHRKTYNQVNIIRVLSSGRFTLAGFLYEFLLFARFDCTSIHALIVKVHLEDFNNVKQSLDVTIRPMQHFCISGKIADKLTRCKANIETTWMHDRVHRKVKQSGLR